VFDSKKKRLEGVVEAPIRGKKTGTGGGNLGATAVRSKGGAGSGGAGGSGGGKWRFQSQQFREAMKAARMYSHMEKTGQTGVAVTSSAQQRQLGGGGHGGGGGFADLSNNSGAVDPSYIQCPHCMRSYNEKAAERHIPKCASIINKPSFLSKGTGQSSYSPTKGKRS